MSCLLFIAGLCFATVDRIEVSDSSTIGRWAIANVGQGEVQIVLGSDSLRGEFDARRMQRACSGGACVSYHKYCQIGEEFTCYYSTDSAQHAEWLRVSAPNFQAFAEAERSLSLVGDSPNAVVPLAMLRVESTTRSPPFCRRRGRGPQCQQ